MWYRVIAINQAQGAGYAEQIRSFRVLNDNQVFVTDLHGLTSFCDADKLIKDPEIIRVLPGGQLVKYKLVEEWEGDAEE